jgi:hypothetical protein
MWQAFVDDSGHRQHAPVLVLGGFLAPYSQWQRFIEDWRLMLDMDPGIAYFKMNEAHRLRGEFIGWSESRRDERVRLAYQTIEDYVSLQVSCIIDLKALDRVVPTNPLTGRPMNPFLVAFGGLISGVARNQERFSVHEKIDFIFDDQVMEKSKIVEGWEEFKENSPPGLKALMGDIPGFRDDEDVLPLQAADLLAWWVRKMATEEPDHVYRVGFPWKPRRQIPGMQFHFDEAMLVKAREATVSSGTWAADIPSSAEQPD